MDIDRSTDDTAVSTLPDDVVLEILVRIKDDAAALFRCVTACKRWRRLVADPLFLRRCWPEEACPSLVGFFIRDESVAPPCFVPAPRSVMGRGCRALSTFMSAPSAGLLNHAKPLVSRHGHLLVRLSPRTTGVMQLAVCNLLAGEYHVLPPLNCGCGQVDPVDYWCGYTLLSGADYRSDSSEPPPQDNTPSFKVGVIDVDYNLHTFSSGEGSWSMPTKCFGTQEYAPLCRGRAVVCHGTAHWLFYDVITSCLCAVGMDVGTGHISLTRTPFLMADTWHPSLTLATDRTLLFILTHTGGSEVTIWENVNGTIQWLPKKIFQLTESGRKLTKGISSIYMLGETYGTMIVQDNSGCMYLADVETETAEELVDWPGQHDNRVDVVPLHMDWLAFLLSRLRSQS